MQRDWVGHVVQALAIFVALGLPLAYWGSNINATVAILMSRVDRQDHDINDQRLTQTLVTGQLLDVNKTLTRIDTQLGDIRERLPTSTKR